MYRITLSLLINQAIISLPAHPCDQPSGAGTYRGFRLRYQALPESPESRVVHDVKRKKKGFDVLFLTPDYRNQGTREDRRKAAKGEMNESVRNELIGT